MTCFEEIHSASSTPNSSLLSGPNTFINACDLMQDLGHIYLDIYKPDKTHLTWTKCDWMTQITQPGYNPDVHMFVHLSPNIMDYTFI